MRLSWVRQVHEDVAARMLQAAALCCVAGECCRAAEPGFFRACYAWMEAPGARKTTVRRISDYLKSLPHANSA